MIRMEKATTITRIATIITVPINLDLFLYARISAFVPLGFFFSLTDGDP